MSITRRPRNASAAADLGIGRCSALLAKRVEGRGLKKGREQTRAITNYRTAKQDADHGDPPRSRGGNFSRTENAKPKWQGSEGGTAR
jgi:hypothetical protein